MDTVQLQGSKDSLLGLIAVRSGRVPFHDLRESAPPGCHKMLPFCFRPVLAGRTDSLAGAAMHRVRPHLLRDRYSAYLEVGGILENAQAIAAHESPRATKLYEKRMGDEPWALLEKYSGKLA
jgi:hypothetical protein